MAAHKKYSTKEEAQQANRDRANKAYREKKYPYYERENVRAYYKMLKKRKRDEGIDMIIAMIPEDY